MGFLFKERMRDSARNPRPHTPADAMAAPIMGRAAAQALATRTLRMPTRSDALAPRLDHLFGRTLLLLPHYDDECAAAGLLQRLRDVTVLFLTNSAPMDPFFWGSYGSPELYSSIRRQESRQGLALAGVSRVMEIGEYLRGQSPHDQQLHQHLPSVLAACRQIVRSLGPDTVLSPAYEGGHPDHDAGSFLASRLAKQFAVAHWELPYYHRGTNGELVTNSFLPFPGDACVLSLRLSRRELKTKQLMWQQYKSQSEALASFAMESESYRPAPPYDYLRPPHEGVLNYEAWGWKVRGTEVVAAFAGLPAV